MAEPGVIRLEQLIEHPPTRVWQALTDPALMAKWWAAGDIRPTVGHRFQLDMGPQFGKQSCEVIAVVPQRQLSYLFAPGALNTTITWRLAAEGTGTRLSLEHTGFDLGSPMGKAAFAGMGSGWPRILAGIGAVLSGA